MGISLKNSQYAEPFNGTTLTITGLTSTRVPYITTGGLFTDAVGFTYNSNTLTAPSVAATNLTSGRVPVAGTVGLLGDDAGLTYDSATKALSVGVTTGGGSITVNSTLAELITSPMVTGGWTLGYDTGGWAISGGVLSKTASTGTQTATAVSGMTAAPVAGQKYLVTAVVSAASGTTTWTLGGTSIPSITAAATYTYVVTAATTAKIIFSGVAASTCSITSLSVKSIDTVTGNATVTNDLTVGRVLASVGSVGYPSISFVNDATSGFFSLGSAGIRMSSSGVYTANVSTGGINLQPSAAAFGLRGGATLLYSDASNQLDLRTSTNQQIFNIYNTYTDGSNYERLKLTGVAGASVNITAETAGTGGDNLDIVLTPAGAGSLKKGTNFAVSSTGTVSGVSYTTASIAADGTEDTTITDGLFYVESAAGGALFRSAPSLAVQIVGTSTAFSGTTDNAGTINIYRNGSIIRVQNKTAGAVTVKFLVFKLM